MADDKALTPRADDFSAWYNEVVLRAELADYSPVRGCMVIRPYGYRLWELMRDQLDLRFKETGHQNAYFPLFIPQSFLAREAEHVEGFAKEAAIVTHTRLKATGEAGAALIPDPDSEAGGAAGDPPHLGDDHLRDVREVGAELPRPAAALINQWANVVRWEMRTRLFLRTTEFLWQEGHTAHVTEAEAEEETLRMLGVYREFMEEWMAMPVVTGRKSESEKFAGALRTYTCEAMMQDNRALQAGTSHNLGQNFSKQFDLLFADREGGGGVRLEHQLGRLHPDDRRAGDDARRRPGAGDAAAPGADPGGDRPDLPQGRGAAGGDGKAREIAAAARRDPHPRRRPRQDEPGRQVLRVGDQGRPLPHRGRAEGPREGAAGARRRVVAEGEERKEFLPEAEVLELAPGAARGVPGRSSGARARRREENSYRGVDRVRPLREIMEGDGGFVYAGWCGGGVRGRASRTRPRPPSAASPARSSAPRRRPPAASSAAATPWPRRCGRRRIERCGMACGIRGAMRNEDGDSSMVQVRGGFRPPRRGDALRGCRSPSWWRGGGRRSTCTAPARSASGSRSWTDALEPMPHLIAYSVKANGNLGVLRTLAELGAGADIVSAGELRRALLAGIPAERIVFSGVGKTVPSWPLR
jgi:prolyl-tRNA synthetase